jgi:hypothetical protein
VQRPLASDANLTPTVAGARRSSGKWDIVNDISSGRGVDDSVGGENTTSRSRAPQCSVAMP